MRWLLEQVPAAPPLRCSPQRCPHPFRCASGPGFLLESNSSSATLSSSTFTRAWPRKPHCGGSVNRSTKALTLSSLTPREVATRAICKRAASGLICGSKPLAEANAISAGTTVLVGRLFPLMKAATLFMTLVCNGPLVGPRLLPLEATRPDGPVPYVQADGRGQK